MYFLDYIVFIFICWVTSLKSRKLTKILYSFEHKTPSFSMKIFHSITFCLNHCYCCTTVNMVNCYYSLRAKTFYSTFLKKAKQNAISLTSQLIRLHFINCLLTNKVGTGAQIMSTHMAKQTLDTHISLALPITLRVPKILLANVYNKCYCHSQKAN